MSLKAEIIPLYKELGETPLETLVRFRETHPQYEETKMTYLGRLDPMAEGVLLVLAQNTKDKEKYLAWDKAYEFEVLWAVESDTYDILGKVKPGKTPEKLEWKMEGLMKKIKEKKTQSYPTFSSKVFRGNFLKVREANIEELNIPERGIKVFSIDHIHTRVVKGEEVLKEVLEKIALVKGDFRQKEILKGWNELLKGREGEQFYISKFSILVSAGTYIRALAEEMGKILGSGALAYSIKRTRVGEYSL
jgi:tRNA pseudouridine(55) synthase